MLKIVALNLRNILYLHHQTTTKRHGNDRLKHNQQARPRIRNHL
jgi:hypothetical protein